MLKRFLSAVSAVALTVTCAAAATFVAEFQFRKDQNDSTAVSVSNLSDDGANVYAESRVRTAHCRGDLYATGPHFTDGSNMVPNSAGVVAESNCSELHFRSNGVGPIRFSVGSPTTSPREVLRLDRTDGGQFTMDDGGRLAVSNRSSHVEAALTPGLNAASIGTVTNNELDLVTGERIAAAILPGGGIELLPQPRCPRPTHGGVTLCVNTDGQLVAIGKGGPIVFAQPSQ